MTGPSRLFGFWRLAHSHGQGFFFFFLHVAEVFGGLVVDAAEVEDAVDDDAVELVGRGGGEAGGVVAHGVEGDDDVAVEGVALAVVEGDDVGVVVVAQVFVVVCEDALVVHEHVADFACLLSVGCCHAANPFGCLPPFDGGHLHSFCVVSNHVVA